MIIETLPIPEYLAATARREAAPALREWVADLPRIVAQLADRWELRLEAPYEPGGTCSWVAPATDARGRDLVLKVGWAHPESEHEADGLRRWAGAGAVILYDQHVFGGTNALLLERCVPGTRLGSTCAEPEQDLVVAELLPRLWHAPAGGTFRTLQAMCADWADEFEYDLTSVPSHPLDPGLTRAGIQLFRDLPGSADRSVLLCTDLHADNILAARREPWLVIDPKPYLGDPTYDVLQHMFNCQTRLERDPHALVRRLADLLGLDPDRLRLWMFARAIQESIQSPWLCPVAQQLAPS